jgi:hypothetical protein
MVAIFVYSAGYRSSGRITKMKTFLIACAAAVVLALIGSVVLGSIQEPVDKAFSTTGVRLGA